MTTRRERFAATIVGPGRPLRLVISSNEGHAGTEIEPATDFGSRFRDRTREFAGHLCGRSTSATQERQPP
jgi:hypothetical protein